MKNRIRTGLWPVLLAWLSGCGQTGASSESVLGDRERGRIALRQYACPTCHVIPGMVDAQGQVGPPLDRWASRGYIAGLLPNTPDHLVDWLRHTQHIAPGSAMPDLDVAERDAWDMAAYLYSAE